MNYELPVVAVDLDGQRALINKSDFDASIHKLWEDAEKPADEAAPQDEAPSAPAPKLRKNAAK